MKEKINEINLKIKEKSKLLKAQAERDFATITIPKDLEISQTHAAKDGGSTPPISYILYGISGLSAIGVFTAESKFLYLCAAAASAYGGYRLSKSTHDTTIPTSSSSKSDIGSLKNEVTSKVLKIVKSITAEWEVFMEQKQKEIQSVISASTLSESEKDSLTSKVFIYEIIDISVSEFSSMLNSISNSSNIKIQLDLYKSKILSAIDSATMKQITKYNSII